MVSLQGVFVSFIVCISFLGIAVILNGLASLRDRRKANHFSPQDLRKNITALAGDLCGYLIGYGKELNPPFDPSATGSESLPDDPEIVATFTQRFGSRLAVVRDGLGNRNLLLGNIGEVLEGGARNGEDVWRIVLRLRDSLGLLDHRSGTKPV
jgi:hypothetical protein